MKLNEPGRQELGRYRSPVSRHSMQSYTLTYQRLRQREPLIALGSHQVGGGGASFLHPRYPHRWVKIWFKISAIQIDIDIDKLKRPRKLKQII